MNRRKPFLAAAAALLLFAACSSAPKVKEEIFERRNQAARHLESGNRYFRDAQYEQALAFYELALDDYTALDDREGRVTAYNSIGKVHFLAGDLDLAMERYIAARELAESAGRPVLILQAVNNIGEVYLRRGQNDEAAELFRRILENHPVREVNSPELAVLYHNSGVVLRNQGRLDEAVAEAEKAVELNRSAKRFEELASNYYLVSSVYFRREAYPEALRYAELALEYDKRMENSPGIAQDLLAIGTIGERTGRTAEAHDMYKRAFLVYRSLSHGPGMIRGLEALIRTADKLELKEEAVLYREAREKLRIRTGS